jgi:hypothetical protein
MEKKPLAERLAAFEEMWTTEADRYVLWRSKDAGLLPMTEVDGQPY